MLMSSKTKIFDDTGKQLGFIYEIDIRFNSKNNLVEAFTETHCDPDSEDNGGCLAPPYAIKKWWVKDINKKEDLIEIHLTPQI